MAEDYQTKYEQLLEAYARVLTSYADALARLSDALPAPAQYAPLAPLGQPTPIRGPFKGTVGTTAQPEPRAGWVGYPGTIGTTSAPLQPDVPRWTGAPVLDWDATSDNVTITSRLHQG